MNEGGADYEMTTPTAAPDAQRQPCKAETYRPRPVTGRACLRCGTTVSRKWARWCDSCRWTTQRKRATVSRWNEEKDALLRRRYDPTVRGRAAAIAKALGMPKWAVTRRAGALGLARPWPKGRKDWTPAEVAFLQEHAGTRHINWLRQQLGRSLTSVAVKMKKLRISRRVTDGYTLRALEEALGADHRFLVRWVEKGWLKGTRLDENSERKTWNFTEMAVKKFLREHWDAIDLRRVDQSWLGDVLFGRGTL